MHKRVTKLVTVLCTALPALPIGATGEQSLTHQTTDPAFSIGVMDVFKIKGEGVAITGRIDSGIVRTGDSVCLVAAKVGTRVLAVDTI